MFNVPYFWIGFVVIVFIISVTLMIFAPKSVNFYPEDTYPIIKYINDNNTAIINDDLTSIKDDKNWVCWPDEKLISGVYQIYPLYMFSTLTNRSETCDLTHGLIQTIPDIKTCTFLKIGANSHIKKHKRWKEISNHTLCCLFVLEAPADLVEKCGVWVNGESKKIKKDALIIFDSSKEHSIYNKTDYPVYCLMLDITRPEIVPNGSSNVEGDDELIQYIETLKRE